MPIAGDPPQFLRVLALGRFTVFPAPDWTRLWEALSLMKDMALPCCELDNRELLARDLALNGLSWLSMAHCLECRRLHPVRLPVAPRCQGLRLARYSPVLQNPDRVLSLDLWLAGTGMRPFFSPAKSDAKSLIRAVQKREITSR